MGAPARVQGSLVATQSGRGGWYMQDWGSVWGGVSLGGQVPPLAGRAAGGEQGL